VSESTNNLISLVGYGPRSTDGRAKVIIAIDGDTAYRLGLTCPSGQGVTDDQSLLATMRAFEALPQSAVDLINRIKAHEAETLKLVREVGEHLYAQEPKRWASIARTDLQTGFMALVRASPAALLP